MIHTRRCVRFVLSLELGERLIDKPLSVISCHQHFMIRLLISGSKRQMKLSLKAIV